MKKIFLIVCSLLLALSASSKVIEVPDAGAMNLMIQGGGVAAGGGGDCANAEYVPTADTLVTDWTIYGGEATHYESVDEGRGSESCNDTSYDNDDGSVYYTLRFEPPGDCDVNAVTVYLYGYNASGAGDGDVDISDDNSTWETAVQVDQPNGEGSAAEDSAAFTSLGYSSPSYIYVRFQPNAVTWGFVHICALTIEVNP